MGNRLSSERRWRFRFVLHLSSLRHTTWLSFPSRVSDVIDFEHSYNVFVIQFQKSRIYKTVYFYFQQTRTSETMFQWQKSFRWFFEVTWRASDEIGTWYTSQLVPNKRVCLNQFSFFYISTKGIRPVQFFFRVKFFGNSKTTTRSTKNLRWLDTTREESHRTTLVRRSPRRSARISFDTPVFLYKSTRYIQRSWSRTTSLEPWGEGRGGGTTVTPINYSEPPV